MGAASSKASGAASKKKARNRAGSAGRARTRSRKVLRGAVAVSMVIAIVVLVSLAFSDARRDGRQPTKGGQTSPSGPPEVIAGAAGLLLQLDEVIPGFIVAEKSIQSLTDIAAGASDSLFERDRLQALGFREAAITVGFKAPDASGSFAGSDVVVQIIRFETPAGASAQLEADRAGALARDFGALTTEETRSLPLADSAFEFVASGPAGPRGQVKIRGAAILQGSWTVAVVASSAPGAAPVSGEEVGELAGRQVEMLSS